MIPAAFLRTPTRSVNPNTSIPCHRERRRTTDCACAAWWRNRDDLLTLGYATATGAGVAASVFVFDVSIQYVHDLPDIFAQNLHLGGGRATGLQIGDFAVPFRCIMPIGAGGWAAHPGARPSGGRSEAENCGAGGRARSQGRSRMAALGGRGLLPNASAGV